MVAPISPRYLGRAGNILASHRQFNMPKGLDISAWLKVWRAPGNIPNGLALLLLHCLCGFALGIFLVFYGAWLAAFLLHCLCSFAFGIFFTFCCALVMLLLALGQADFQF